MRRRKPSWLDQWVYRFQHRWETSPQYRAVVAGVCGLLLVVLMCSCTGILTVAANAGLAGMGGGSSDGGNTNTGTKQLGGAQTFPTFTLPPYPASTVPVGSIPDSQTPGPTPTDPPTATAVPTATPCQSGCGGGGGGGGGTVTANGSPTPWIHGQTGTINVHTSKPNVGINLLVTFPDGSFQTNAGSGMTDGSGNYSWSVGIPGDCTSGNVHIVVEAGFNGGGNMVSITVYQPCR